MSSKERAEIKAGMQSDHEKRLKFIREQNKAKAEKPKQEEKLPTVPEFIKDYMESRK